MALVEKAFGDIITFTRASGGGRINALGQYEWVAADVPRLTYDPITLQPLGLLVEGQRTNLLLHTANFADAAWQKVNTTVVTAGVSLQGLPINTVEDNATLASHSITQLGAASVTSGTAVTVSIFVKAGSLGHVFLGIGGTSVSANPPFISVDLATGAVAVVAGAVLLSGAVPVGDGWWRVFLVSQVPATGSAVIDARLSRDGVWVNRVYAGNGSNVLFTGAQLEIADAATSYIPTTTAQVTRAADVCSVNTLSPWYNAMEGTLVVDGIPLSASGALANVVTLEDGTSNNRIHLRHTSTTSGSGIVLVAGVVQASFTSPANSWPIMASRKAAIAYKENSFAFSVSGGAPLTDSAGLVPAVSRMIIGAAPSYSSAFNGIISRITYYPRVIDVQQASA